jgi:hypothetical protein
MHASFYATMCAIALLGLTGHAVGADAGPAPSGQSRGQTRADQPPPGHTQFTDGDRQVTKDWTTQHQAHPPAGLRPQDRLTPDQESRLQPGRPLDPDLRGKVHSAPADLSRRLPAPPPSHRYVTIGGHVGLVDTASHVLRDVIHLHE